MDSFWYDRWREGKIGFHEGKPNTLLEEHVARFGGRRRVLVPLCGKAEDLAYLAALGYEVVGVELVEDAVRAFFDEHRANPEVTPRGELVEYHAGSITILCGDVLATTRAMIGAVDAVYDRAALIALPPEVRVRYAAHLRALTDESGTLLVTLEYDPAKMDGPPFSVVEDEVRTLYAGRAVELIATRDAESARMKQEGISAIERCYWIG